MHFARALWLRIETIHAVIYFASEPAAGANELGLSGFWMGYFGFRAAPMGRVEAGVVEACFFNFAGSFVDRWVPAVWDCASPAALLDVRRESAAASLCSIAGTEAPTAAALVNDRLAAAVDRGSPSGRPLFAANRRLGLPNDPVEAMWHLCTTLREHRGDGHVAALTAEGIDGIEAHVLISLDLDLAPEDLQRARGWTAHDWDDAVRRCADRGFVDGRGALTSAGRKIRSDIEGVTDERASSPFAVLNADERAALIDALDPLARAISASGVIRYPNPMGLPSVS